VGKLVYSAIASLDGYISDAEGKFDWAAPDEEVHRFFNELERPNGTYLYGRRMYETMAFWETAGENPELAGYAREYADIWRAADKIVFSGTLASVETERTRLESAFDPEAIAALKARSGSDISIGGAELAGRALTAGLVDQCHLVIAPALVGGGTPVFPDGVRLDLELTGHRRFGGGMAYLGYAVAPSS
jgi:dihydrofolate reductase